VTCYDSVGDSSDVDYYHEFASFKERLKIQIHYYDYMNKVESRVDDEIDFQTFQQLLLYVDLQLI
jgi:hypothetical protein